MKENKLHFSNKSIYLRAVRYIVRRVLKINDDQGNYIQQSFDFNRYRISLCIRHPPLSRPISVVSIVLGQWCVCGEKPQRQYTAVKRRAYRIEQPAVGSKQKDRPAREASNVGAAAAARV